MNIEEIRSGWVSKNNDKQASVDMWDSMAGQYKGYSVPNFEEDTMLRLLNGLGVLKKDARVLDVGCGSGRYSLALAGCCKEVTGIDLSSKMLQIAEDQKKAMGIENAAFIRTDWHEFDLEKAGMCKQYDIVFAHMTPAIGSARSFEKLTQASKGLCLMAKPTRRTDPVSDEVKRLAGITEHRESSEADIFYGFGLLWLAGMNPKLEYFKQRWNMKKTLEEAYGLYINRMKTYKSLTEAEEQNLKDYIDSLAADGMVSEAVDTTITMMYWEV